MLHVRTYIYIYIYVYRVSLKSMERGFGYTITRSPHAPYSIYLRGTIYVYVYTDICTCMRFADSQFFR